MVLSGKHDLGGGGRRVKYERCCECNRTMEEEEEEDERGVVNRIIEDGGR